jgi:hypothetical protein
MSRTLVAAVASAALMSGGLAAAAVGLAAGTAQAAPQCSPSNANVPPCAPPEGLPTCNAFGQCGQLWCPGSGMEAVPGWDTNVCHTFYFDPNAPLTKPVKISGNPPGPPPPPPPPCIPFINCLPGLTHPLP